MNKNENIFEPNRTPFEEFFEELLVSALRETEKTPKIINPNRYREMLEAKKIFEHLLEESFEDPEVEVTLHHGFCSASISAVVDTFEVVSSNAPVFCGLLEMVNTFEVVPLTNGRLQIGFTFNGIMIPLETRNESIEL